MMRRYELSDAQWEAIRGELPGKATDPGRTDGDDRLCVNAVPYVARTGIPWPDLPERFGEPNTVWKRFDRWCGAGVWERLARVLGEPDLAELQLDSTMVKAHPIASTGRRRAGKKRCGRPAVPRPRPGRADDQGPRLGGCEGPGRAAAADGRPVRRRPAGDAAARRLPAGRRRLRDRRRGLRRRRHPQARTNLRARACVKPNPTRKRPKRYDRQRYKHRNLVERFFGTLKRFRRVATRYEKKAENYLGFA